MEADSRPCSVDANRNADPSRQSQRSTGKLSESSFRSRKRDKCRRDQDEKSCASDRARTRTRPPGPDQDRRAEGEHRRSSQSFYSEDYENMSPSERTLSPYSRTPSPGPRRGVPAKRVSSSPIYKPGLHTHTHTQTQRLNTTCIEAHAHTLPYPLFFFLLSCCQTHTSLTCLLLYPPFLSSLFFSLSPPSQSPYSALSYTLLSNLQPPPQVSVESCLGHRGGVSSSRDGAYAPKAKTLLWPLPRTWTW